MGCSEASLCEDAKRMQRSVVMPGEERKMQSGPHRPPARIKSGGGHAVDGGEQRQETVWRNYSRVCSQRAVAPLQFTRGERERAALVSVCQQAALCRLIISDSKVGVPRRVVRAGKPASRDTYLTRRPCSAFAASSRGTPLPRKRPQSTLPHPCPLTRATHLLPTAWVTPRLNHSTSLPRAQDLTSTQTLADPAPES